MYIYIYTNINFIFSKTFINEEENSNLEMMEIEEKKHIIGKKVTFLVVI